MNGELNLLWDTVEELEEELNTPAGKAELLMAPLAFEVARTGLLPSATQIYAFGHPPILGGELAVDNVQLLDFVTSVGMAGQIHHQVKDLPPGAQVSGVQLVEPPKQSAWRRWLGRKN